MRSASWKSFSSNWYASLTHDYWRNVETEYFEEGADGDGREERIDRVG